MECNPSNVDMKRNKAKAMKSFKTFSKNAKLRSFLGAENQQYTEDMIYSIGKWVWKKKVRKPFESEIISETDAKRFERGLNEYIDNIDKRDNIFTSFIKLPKVLTRKDPNSDKFYRDIEHAQSFNERQIKQGSIHVNNLIDNMFKMFKDKKHYMSDAEYKAFKQMEKEIFVAREGDSRINALDKMHTLMKKGDAPGKVLIRFKELLTFERPPENQLERDIQSEYNILRKDTARDLLNGAVTQKHIIEVFGRDDASNKRYLTRAAEKIQDAINSLMFQMDIDNKTIVEEVNAGGIVPIGEFKVYNHKTKVLEPYKVRNSDGELVLAENIKKYSPEYVIEMVDLLRDVTDYSQSKDRSKWNNITPSEMLAQVEKMVNPEAISNRLKVKHENDAWSSLDPAFYLNKYVNDVANFNFRSRVNLAYTEAASNLIKMNKNGGVDMGIYSEHLLDVISEIRDSALNQNRGEITELDRVIQIVNGWEYISKMGWSVRSGLKNRTQGLLNWVWFGMKGYNRSSSFYETNSREGADSSNHTNTEMLERQLKRFAMVIGGKQAAAGIQAATAGSLDYLLVPKGMDIDVDGNLVMAKESSVARKISEEMSRIASAETMGDAIPANSPELLKTMGKFLPGPAKMMAWAENKNRLNTFKIAFANAFLAEKSQKESHRKSLAKDLGKEVHKITDKEIYDRIEKISGNEALNMVKTLHFDYNRWAKSKYLQSNPGKVLGQFQHFKFAYFDLMHNMTKDFWGDLKDGNFTQIDPISGKKVINESFARMTRMALLQSMLPGAIGALFGVELGGLPGLLGESSSNLIENPIASDMKMWYDYLSSDPNESEEELLRKYDATYGKPIWMTQIGMPAVSDIATLGELFDWWDLTPQEYQDLRNLNMNVDDEEWQYNVARTFNVAMARFGWHTLPAIANMNYEKAARITAGTYYPKWLKNWFGMEKPLIPILTKKIYNESPLSAILPHINSGKKRSKENAAILRKRAFAALSSI